MDSPTTLKITKILPIDIIHRKNNNNWKKKNRFHSLCKYDYKPSESTSYIINVNPASTCHFQIE